MKKIIGFILLLFFPFSFLAAQSAESQFTDIYGLIDQLIENQREQSELIEKLQTASAEDLIKIEKLLQSLKNSEETIRKQIALSNSLGDLIADQAIYYKSLEKKLKFWKVTSGILAALLTGIIVMAAIK